MQFLFLSGAAKETLPISKERLLFYYKKTKYTEDGQIVFVNVFSSLHQLS